MVAVAIFVHTCSVLKKKWLLILLSLFPFSLYLITLWTSSRCAEQTIMSTSEKHKAPRFLWKLSPGVDWRLEKLKLLKGVYSCCCYGLWALNHVDTNRCHAHVCSLTCLLLDFKMKLYYTDVVAQSVRIFLASIASICITKYRTVHFSHYIPSYGQKQPMLREVCLLTDTNTLHFISCSFLSSAA